MSDSLSDADILTAEALRQVTRNPCDEARYCAQLGRLPSLQKVRALDLSFPWTCEAAAQRGDLVMLQWLRSQGCPWDVETCNNAAKEGHFEVLQWARSQGCPWEPDTCWEAAVHGHLDILRWLRSQDPPCPWEVPEVFYYARLLGHWDVVLFVLDTVAIQARNELLSPNWDDFFGNVRNAAWKNFSSSGRRCRNVMASFGRITS